MTKLSVISREDVGALPGLGAPRQVTGELTSARLSPDDHPLWLYDVAMADGAAIHWEGVHGEDALYVLDGALEIDGRRCPTGGAVVVEADVAATATAVGPTRVAHFGSTEDRAPVDGRFGPPSAVGRGVVVVGPEGRFESGRDEGVRAVWFTDGTADTHRAQLLLVAAPPTDDTRGKPHSHSESEIIFVLDGVIRMGVYRLEPYSALCVPADARYALVGGLDGHRFLNFRRDVSEQTYQRGSEPILETALARGGHAVDPR